MIDAIQERVSINDARNRIYIEWQTKILAGFIATTVQSEKAACELQKVATGLSMLPKSDDDKPTTVEPKAGSFEKLTGLFGGPR